MDQKIKSYYKEIYDSAYIFATSVEKDNRTEKTLVSNYVHKYIDFRKKKKKTKRRKKEKSLCP